MLHRHGLRGLFVVLIGLLSHNEARADQIFVANAGNGTIGAYTTAGVTVNRALISGLSFPFGIAVSGSDVFVANAMSGTIGEYTTAGDTVNPSLISGLIVPYGIAVSGSDLFVSSAGIIPTAVNYGVGAYTTTGATENPVLISGLRAPYSIALAPTVPEPGSGILTLFGLVLAGLAIKKIEKKWHNGCRWAYQSDEQTDTHGPPHLPELGGRGRPFAHFLGYGAPVLIFMTAWAILLMYAA